MAPCGPGSLRSLVRFFFFAAQLWWDILSSMSWVIATSSSCTCIIALIPFLSFFRWLSLIIYHIYNNNEYIRHGGVSYWWWQQPRGQVWDPHQRRYRICIAAVLASHRHVAVVILIFYSKIWINFRCFNNTNLSANFHWWLSIRIEMIIFISILALLKFES